MKALNCSKSSMGERERISKSIDEGDMSFNITTSSSTSKKKKKRKKQKKERKKKETKRKRKLVKSHYMNIKNNTTQVDSGSRILNLKGYQSESEFVKKMLQCKESGNCNFFFPLFLLT